MERLRRIEAKIAKICFVSFAVHRTSSLFTLYLFHRLSCQTAVVNRRESLRLAIRKDILSRTLRRKIAILNPRKRTED